MEDSQKTTHKKSIYLYSLRYTGGFSEGSRLLSRSHTEGSWGENHRVVKVVKLFVV